MAHPCCQKRNLWNVERVERVWFLSMSLTTVTFIVRLSSVWYTRLVLFYVVYYDTLIAFGSELRLFLALLSESWHLNLFEAAMKGKRNDGGYCRMHHYSDRGRKTGRAPGDRITHSVRLSMHKATGDGRIECRWIRHRSSCRGASMADSTGQRFLCVFRNSSNGHGHSQGMRDAKKTTSTHSECKVIERRKRNVHRQTT